MRKISSSANQRCSSAFSSLRRRQVVTERLLDDHARPALPLASLADLLDDRLERLRRHGEVEDPVAVGAVGASQSSSICATESSPLSESNSVAM